MTLNAWIRWCAALGLAGASLMGWMVRLPGGPIACLASFSFGMLSLGAVIFRWERFFRVLGFGRSGSALHWKDLLLTTAMGVWCIVVAVFATFRMG